MSDLLLLSSTRPAPAPSGTDATTASQPHHPAAGHATIRLLGPDAWPMAAAPASIGSRLMAKATSAERGVDRVEGRFCTTRPLPGSLGDVT